MVKALYAYASGAHALSAQRQFLGPTVADTAGALYASTWQGSLIVQYAWRDYDLPSVAYLDKFQKLIRYEFKRRDLYLPLVFGLPLGPRGRFGSMAFGPALNFTWVDYGSEFLRVVEKLFFGGESARLSGMTFIPSLGLDFQF